MFCRGQHSKQDLHHTIDKALDFYSWTRLTLNYFRRNDNNIFCISISSRHWDGGCTFSWKTRNPSSRKTRSCLSYILAQRLLMTQEARASSAVLYAFHYQTVQVSAPDGLINSVNLKLFDISQYIVGQFEWCYIGIGNHVYSLIIRDTWKICLNLPADWEMRL